MSDQHKLNVGEDTNVIRGTFTAADKARAEILREPTLAELLSVLNRVASRSEHYEEGTGIKNRPAALTPKGGK